MNKLLCLLLLLQTSILFGQTHFEDRIEFDVRDGDYGSFEMHLFGQDGFILRSKGTKHHNYDYFQYQLFDTNLNEVESQVVEIGLGSFYDKISVTDSARLIDIFYRSDGATKLVSVESKTLESENYELSLPAHLKFISGELVNKKLYEYCTLEEKPYLMVMDWMDGTHKMLPILIPDNPTSSIYFRDLSTNQKASEVFLTIVAKQGIQESYYLITFDKDDEIENTINLSTKLTKKCTSLSFSSFENGVYVLSGTYSSRPSLSSRSSLSNLSEGIYFAQFDGREIGSVTYHNFLDIQSFYDFLPKGEQRKIQKKKDLKSASNKEIIMEKLTISHDLIMADEGYYFICESYFPTNLINSDVSSKYDIVNSTNNFFFDGFQYSQATVVKFDSLGKIEWDKTFKMWPSYKPYVVEKTIQVNTHLEENLSMAFVHRFRIKTLGYNSKGELIKDSISNIIFTKLEGDDTNNANSILKGWYGNNFVAYGKQAILNRLEVEVKKRRTVFFVHKVSY